MKKLILFLLFLGLARFGFPQFVPMPLNFPGEYYHPWFLDAIDSNTLWVGVNYVVPFTGYLHYSDAIKTTDGGNSWQFYTIPVAETATICDINAIDANICYYVIFNGTSSIWRTLDGGVSWVNTIPNQFVGGWANFYHAASADTGMAGGDPNNGYWEIQHTTDGGNTWTRVPSADIPPALNQEYGIFHGYSACGNNIWFSTSKGRCYRSVDKGFHWTVEQLPGQWSHPLVCFVDSLRGVFYDLAPYYKSIPVFNGYYMTTDGGLSWTQKTIGSNYFIRHFSRVPGIDGGMVIGAYDSCQNYSLTVLFTPNFMDTVILIQRGLSSSGEMDFSSPVSGWLAGFGTETNNIYAFTGNLWVVTDAPETAGNRPQMQIYPNPATDHIIIETPTLLTDHRLTIFDMSGQPFITCGITSQKTPIDISRLQGGVYLVKIFGEKGVLGGKFIKH